MEYFKVKDLAEMFGVSTATIKKEYERKKLNGFFVGNELRFTQRDIDDYTNIVRYGKTTREIQLENEVKELKKIIADKDSIIKNVELSILKIIKE